VQCEFVTAGAGTSPALESAEKILYPVSNSIVSFRITHYSLAVGFSGNAMPVTESLQFCPQFVAVEAFVADEEHCDPLCLEQFDDVRSLIGLSGDQFEVQRPAAQIGHRHQLGVSPASGLAHGLSRGSFAGIGRALMHHHVCSVYKSDRAAVGSGDLAQHSVPQTAACPMTKVSEDGLPRAEFARQVTPRAGVSQPVE